MAFDRAMTKHFRFRSIALLWLILGIFGNASASAALSPTLPGALVHQETHGMAPVPAEQQTNSLWTAMREGFALDLSYDNPRIATERRWYQKNPRYIERVFTRASPFLHHIAKRAEERGVPLEFALLPVVESAFDPFAYSHGRASGLWQFIPGTARRFGLKQNWWYDGRRDVLASTEAALDYLETLNRLFDGDWLHALAAYNAGEGNVLKAIRKNRAKGKSTSFWVLDLPRETEAYVPRLLALSQIVADPDRYGVTLVDIPDEPRIGVVALESQIDLAQAARLADMDLDTLYRYNPAFNRWATDPDGPHRLLLPRDRIAHFEEAYRKLPREQRITWTRYVIKPGDSLIKLARKHQTTPEIIQKANQIRGNMIRVGQTLMIPTASAEWERYTYSQDNRLARQQSAQPSKSRDTRVEHTVRQGDTLWDLSRKYGVSTRQLAKWNGMAPGDTLKPGKRLVIWKKGSATVAAVGEDREVIRRVTYTVRSGDSLSRIASRFSVGVNEIVRWNGLSRNAILRPGKSLKLYVDVTAAN